MYRETGLVNSPPPSGQDDAALLNRVQRGDEDAMAALFDRYSKIVYSSPLCTRASRAASSCPEGGGEFTSPVSLYIKRTHY